MAYTYSWDGSNIAIKLSGEVSFAEIKEANDHIIGDERFDTMEYQIADFTEVTNVSMQEDDVKLMSVFDRSATYWNKRIRVAFIGKEDYLINLFMVYIQMMRNTEWECNVFENFGDAEKWCKEPVLD